MFVANLIRIKENKKISIFAEKTKKISFFELYVQISLLQTSPSSPAQLNKFLGVFQALV